MNAPVSKTGYGVSPYEGSNPSLSVDRRRDRARSPTARADVVSGCDQGAATSNRCASCARRMSCELRRLGTSRFRRSSAARSHRRSLLRSSADIVRGSSIIESSRRTSSRCVAGSAWTIRSDLALIRIAPSSVGAPDRKGAFADRHRHFLRPRSAWEPPGNADRAQTVRELRRRPGAIGCQNVNDHATTLVPIPVAVQARCDLESILPQRPVDPAEGSWRTRLTQHVDVRRWAYVRNPMLEGVQLDHETADQHPTRRQPLDEVANGFPKLHRGGIAAIDRDHDHEASTRAASRRARGSSQSSRSSNTAAFGTAPPAANTCQTPSGTQRT